MMRRHNNQPTMAPGWMPVLSPGRHRSARRGACFMEYASYLAGERWSDQPDCTHPSLSHLARCVNDLTGQNKRQELLPLIPDVIGLSADVPLADVWIARECALAALPVAAERRQRVIAVGLLRCEEQIAESRGLAKKQLTARATAALEEVPLAYAWAVSFSQRGRGRRAYHQISTPAIIDYAVRGISEACIRDADDRLVQLLRDVIAQCRRWLAPVASTDSTLARH